MNPGELEAEASGNDESHANDLLFGSSAAAQAVVQLALHGESGAVLTANRAAERFYGWPLAAMQSMLVTDLDDMTLSDWRAHVQSLAPGSAVRLERAHRVASGERRDTVQHIALVLRGENMLVHMIVQDVTDRTRAEAAHRDLSERLKSLRDVAGRVGHDFNNVLTVVRGSSAFLQDAIGTNSQAAEDLANIDRATDRAEQLLRQLVDEACR